MKFAPKLIRHYPPHIRHVATRPWKIKKSNFSRYSADMDKNANILHFKFTAFNSSMRVTVYAELCVSRIRKILSIQRQSFFFGKIWLAQKRYGCRLLWGCVWWLYQLCLCPATFSTAY